MAYSTKGKEKVAKSRRLRKLNPQQTSRKLTQLKYRNPIAYDIARKKEAKRSVVSSQSGLKPRSALNKMGPSARYAQGEKRKVKPKSKLMAAKKYTRTGAKAPATTPVKKKYVTKAQTGVLHAGAGGKSRRALGGKKPVSSYAKKVTSQKNNWSRSSAGPNAVPAQKRKVKYGHAWSGLKQGTQTSYQPHMQRAVRKAGTDRAYNRKLASGKSTYKRTTKKSTGTKRSRGGGGFMEMVNKQRKIRSKRY